MQNVNFFHFIFLCENDLTTTHEYLQKYVSMTRKCHNHKTQTIPREPEEETPNYNSHVTGRTQNNQLQCISYSSRAQPHAFIEIDHEMFSTVIPLLPLIQEGVNIVSCKPITIIEKKRNQS